MKNIYTAAIYGLGYGYDSTADRVRWFLYVDTTPASETSDSWQNPETITPAYLVDGNDWLLAACCAYYDRYCVWPEFQARIVGERDQDSVWIEPVITDGEATFEEMWSRPAAQVPAPTSA